MTGITTTHEHQIEFHRGVLTLTALITLPEELSDMKLGLFDLYHKAISGSAASYASLAARFTAQHRDLRTPKSPIDLEARFMWGVVTGTLRLDVHLCSHGVRTARERFAEEMSANMRRRTTPGLNALFGHTSSANTSPGAILLIG